MLRIIASIVIICSPWVSPVPCPGETETTCIECRCDPKTRSNTCRPANVCPGPLHHIRQVKPKNKNATCPYGDLFQAQCSLCECGGEGRDHCALCFAFPVRRNDQLEQINKLLPQATENRIFNYEVRGWDGRVKRNSANVSIIKSPRQRRQQIQARQRWKNAQNDSAQVSTRAPRFQTAQHLPKPYQSQPQSSQHESIPMTRNGTSKRQSIIKSPRQRMQRIQARQRWKNGQNDSAQQHNNPQHQEPFQSQASMKYTRQQRPHALSHQPQLHYPPPRAPRFQTAQHPPKPYQSQPQSRQHEIIPMTRNGTSKRLSIIKSPRQRMQRIQARQRWKNGQNNSEQQHNLLQHQEPFQSQASMQYTRRQHPHAISHQPKLHYPPPRAPRFQTAQHLPKPYQSQPQSSQHGSISMTRNGKPKRQRESDNPIEKWYTPAPSKRLNYNEAARAPPQLNVDSPDITALNKKID